MNIQNEELINRLANFPNLYHLHPVVVATGQLVPTDWSRGVMLEPTNLRLIAEEFKRIIDFNNIDVVAGIELQGVPMATALSLATGKPHVIVREKPKRAGRTALIGGVNFIKSGVRVLLVDDLIAYGGTKEARAKQLEDLGARITDVATFIQVRAVAPTRPLISGYNFSANDWLERSGAHLHSLIWYHELADLQVKAGTISSELAEFISDNSNGPYWERRENLQRLYEYMKREHLEIQDFVLEFMRQNGVQGL